MKKSNKHIRSVSNHSVRNRSVLVPLSAGFCATVLAVSGCVASNVAVLAVSSSQAFAATNSSNSNSDFPPVRTSLTKEEAEQMEGCEAYFDEANQEFVIRPKNGANEGVISYSLDNKKGDFETIRKVLDFKNEAHGYVPVRFDKRVYIYDSTNPSNANDTLFFQTSVKTINITDNLSIKFAKNLAQLFMQNSLKSAGHLNYINGIENWDTSNVESMEKMFNLASQLEGKLDLSKWNVSKVDKLNLMFSGVGNDNFVLDFSNKKFKNAVNVANMFNSFGGVLIANNWTTVNPTGENPIQKLLDGPNYMLTYYDTSARKYISLSKHLLITDNPTILDKNKTEKYKFYKKVKVIYKTKDKEKSVELELPAVYDSRIDENGKPDASKAASSDPMKVVKPQIDEAIKNAVKDLRTKNPDLNLPENVIPVPVHELKDAKSPIELFQDYYLGLVKEETTKAKTTYTADPKLEYKKVEYDTQPQDGKKQVITGAMKDGEWDPDATSEKEITKAVDGKARVGNKQVTTEEIQPGTKYEADSSLDYKKEQTTEGTKGIKTTTTIYKVDENTGLTNTVQSSESKTTTPAKDKVIKVGNVEKKTSDIPFKKTYEGNEALTYQKQETKTAGQNGKEEVTLTYKVDAKTGLTTEVEAKKGLRTQPVNEVIQVGNKEVIQNNDGSTTTKTYKVNPNDGTLSDPTVVTSRPWTDIASGASVSEVLKGKMTYVADESLPYGQTQKVSDPKDGEKITTPTGKVENGKWVEGEPKVEIKEAVNGVTKVGNKKVETEEIQPGVTYQADNSLTYKQEQPTEGTKGTKTTTTIYKVDENTGLTNTVQSSESKTTTPAKDKVIKVGNVEKKTSDIPFKKTYEGNETLTYQKQETKTAGKNGKEEVTLTYKVDAKTGLTTEVEAKKGSCTQPVNEVIQVGNKEVIQNNDGSTTTKTYKVNPNDGTLSDPTVVTSRPWTNVTPLDQLEQTVTFKDGDKQVASVKVEKGKAISTDGLTSQSMPANPTKENYTFKEWNTKQDGTGTAFNADTVVNNDLTVYAVYKKNSVTPPQPPVQDQKTVTFNKKDGSLLSTVKVETGKKVAASSMPAAPAEDGFTFKEWNTQQDGTGTVFNADTVVNNDLTVYAVYTKNPVTPPAPQPQHDNSEPAVLDTQEAEVLPGKMKYEADETLPYNTQKKIKNPVDGLKIITHTGNFVNGKWEPSEKVETTAAQDGLTKVGNKQVTHEGDKTITTTYDVDPDTGKLTNPKTHTSMPMATLIDPSANPNPNPGPNPNDNGGGNNDDNNGGESVAPDSTDNPELNIGGGNTNNANNNGNGNSGNNTNGSANGTSNGASVNANSSANGSASGVANRMGSSKSRTAGTRSTAALPSTGFSISGVTFASFSALVFGMFSAGAAVNRKRAKHLR